MKFAKTALVVALLATSAAASAATYDFSYTFLDAGSASAGDLTSTGQPMSVTGSFSADLVGDYFQNVSDIHLSLNGVDFLGPLVAVSINASGTFDDSVAPMISTNGALNNFAFADTDLAVDQGASNYFGYQNAAGSEVYAYNANAGGISADSLPANGSWSVVAAPVPEPQTYAMLLAGLGLVGVIARRRRA